MNFIPQNTFQHHCSPALKGPANIVSVIAPLTQVWVLMRTGLEINLSWLSKNDTTGHFKRRLVLGIIVSLLLTMVISKETRAVIIALHKNGLTGKSIAARKIAPQSTIYRIIKNFKERGSIVAKKAPGRPRKTSKRQDRLLKVFQLRDRATSSAELAQEWQQAGVSASARTVRRRLLEQGLVSRRAAKKPLLSRKNIRDRLIFCKRYREWTAEGWGKVIFSDESPFRLFGTSGKQLIRRRRGERYHQSCLMPTVKHPETIHVWGCFSAKGIGSLTVLPKNTAMNKEWYQNVLREQLLPTVQEQFGDQQCLFQHDGAPCHKAKVITKWLREQNIEILGPWPGNSPDLNPIENLWSIIKRRVDKQKPTNSDKMQALIVQEWTAISQDLVQKLIESMPGRIAEVLKKKGQHCKYWLAALTHSNCQYKLLLLIIWLQLYFCMW